jgi:cyclopropane fatty-acyl-phospholipid synthase-like methyltransferase
VSELHPATRGFATADVYERGRPDYPAAAIARIVSRLELGRGRTVLDLAAGTGKLTRLLVPSEANLIALGRSSSAGYPVSRRSPARRSGSRSPTATSTP